MFLELWLCVIAIFIYLYWKDNYNQKGQPPGPTKLPIIGNLHQIAATGKKMPNEAFDILSQKYGPIMSLKMGVERAVVLSSYEDMAGILTKDECSGRVLQALFLDRNFGKEQGIIWGNGDDWKIVRRFTVKTLRDFGFGKKQDMESAMGEEIEDLIRETKSNISKTDGILNMELFFNVSLLNVLWSMVAGQRFVRDDPQLISLLDLNQRGMKLGTFGSDISLAFPVLIKLFPNLTGVTVIKQFVEEFQQFIREMLHDFRCRGTYASDPNCVLDVFLKKMDEEAEGKPSHRIFTEEQVIITLMDLFQTGTETLNGSLSYAILFMVLNPEVQRKVQDEIDLVVPDGNIRFSHKPKMIYTEATLMETLRLGDIVPLIPPRKVMEDFNYKGYEFKKGSTVIPNLYSVMSSKANWGDPEVFRPERFIGPDGQLCNTEKFAPFGFGKRICMGEVLANSSLFLFFTGMLKNFSFLKSPDKPDPGTEPFPGFTLTPKPFEVLIKIR